MPDEQIRQAVQNIIGPQIPLHDNSQTFTAVFINDREHLDRSAIVSAIRHKIISPYMVPMGRSKTNARTIIQPQTTPLGLSLGDLQAFLPPDPLHTLMINLPSLPVQKSCNQTVAITTVFKG
jgi:hypothetical protein